MKTLVAPLARTERSLCDNPFNYGVKLGIIGIKGCRFSEQIKKRVIV